MRRAATALVVLGLALSLLAAPAAEADILELEDGRLVEGVAVKDGDVWFVTDRFGVVEIKDADVKAHLPGKSVDQIVKEHVAKLEADDVAGRCAVAQWLDRIGRKEESRALCDAVLQMDPENEWAHKHLGHVRHRGKWVTPDEAKRAEGYVQHGGKWYTPKEWANLAEAEQKKAKEAEARLQREAIGKAVNAAVRLMMSPDPKVQERGRMKLLALAREHDSDELQKLVERVAEHVKQVQDAREKALSLASAAPGARGMVMGEIRATMSKLKRPIQVFETSLASNIAGGNVRIQLPELELIKVRTFGMIPAAVR